MSRAARSSVEPGREGPAPTSSGIILPCGGAYRSRSMTLMRRGAPQNLIAVCLPVALSVPVAVRAEVWREVKTQHFTLVSDADEKDARRVARQFEVVRSLIGSVSDLRLDPRLSITILAMRDRAGIRS